MNKRNAKVLKEILANYPDNGADLFDTMWLAKYLAGCGVVVPDALTEEQIISLTDGWDPAAENDDVRERNMRDFRDILVRIAKGEP